jgi:hypothetical protein
MRGMLDLTRPVPANEPREPAIARPARRLPLFSLGGVLSAACSTRLSCTPWIVAATGLLTFALWDPVMRGGQPDFILMGLAGYELVIGLTEERR